MPPDACAQHLLDAISELYAIILRISRRIDDTEAMTATQRLALIEIAVVGPLRLVNLASRMDTTPATASRAVDVLEEYGFAERRTDPDDRRAIMIGATAEGTRWARERRALLLEVIASLDRSVMPDSLPATIEALNAALREASGHDEVARGALLAP